MDFETAVELARAQAAATSAGLEHGDKYGASARKLQALVNAVERALASQSWPDAQAILRNALTRAVA